MRLVFRSHALNRLRGQVSIFLPTIHFVTDTSKGLMKQITVHSASADTTFVVGKRRELMAAIDSARSALTPEAVADILPQLEARPELLGDQTTYSKLMNAIAIASASSGDIAGLLTDLASWNTIANVIGLAGAAAEIAEDQLRDRSAQDDPDRSPPQDDSR